jgi:hypothetical protein
MDLRTFIFSVPFYTRAIASWPGGDQPHPASGRARNVQKLYSTRFERQSPAPRVIRCVNAREYGSIFVSVVSVAGWLNQRQQQVIDYLVEENRVLREQTF